jgi:hypothetical protein
MDVLAVPGSLKHTSTTTLRPPSETRMGSPHEIVSDKRR